MSETPKVPDRDSAWPMIRRLLSMAGTDRRWFFFALVLDLGQAALLILGNHFNRGFFEAVTRQDTTAFWMYVGLAVCTALANIPLMYGKVRGMGQFSEGTLARLRGQVARHSTTLPVSALEARHSGDLLSVLNADLGKLKLLLSAHMIDLIGQSVRMVAAFAYILSVNWILALTATILTPLIFIAISALTAPIGRRSEEMQTEVGRVVSVAQDALAGSMVVKAFNLSDLLDARYHQTNRAALKKGLNIARLRSIIDGIALPMSITPFILAVGLGGYFVIQGQVTFGALFAFINLLNFVVNPLSSIPNILAGIGEATGAGRRVFALIDEAPERADGTVTAPADGPAIAIDGLTFAFADSTEPVLKDVTVEVQTGQTVAIVGPSGSGKSTLVKVLLGYYSLPDGKLRLFGVDLNDWRLSAARDQMALVAQDTYLFPISLRENIRLGRPDASDTDVEQAARLAHIHDFIIGLPQGYDTNAGEWGGRLSGGQRQRMSLARAILKDAPLLLLDEPTSALDTESETLVQQALESFSTGKTTLVIAHRLSTIQNADRVLVLQDGAIVEQGTHAELMAHGGVYLDLYQRQFNDTDAGADTDAGKDGAS